MNLKHVFGAIIFFLFSGTFAAYGVVNVVDVERTVFGPTRVGPALPALQFTISAACIVAAILLGRACVSCCRKCVNKKDQA